MIPGGRTYNMGGIELGIKDSLRDSCTFCRLALSGSSDSMRRFVHQKGLAEG